MKMYITRASYAFGIFLLSRVPRVGLLMFAGFACSFSSETLASSQPSPVSVRADLEGIDRQLAQKRLELKGAGKATDDVTVARRVAIKAELAGLEEAKTKLMVEKFEEAEPAKAAELTALQQALAGAHTAEERARLLRASRSIDNELLSVERTSAETK